MAPRAGLHGSDERHAEALVARCEREDASAAQIGLRVPNEPEEKDPVGNAEVCRQPAQRLAFGALAEDDQAHVTGGGHLRESADQHPEMLLRREPPHAQHDRLVEERFVLRGDLEGSRPSIPRVESPVHVFGSSP